MNTGYEIEVHYTDRTASTHKCDSFSVKDGILMMLRYGIPDINAYAVLDNVNYYVVTRTDGVG